jgi:hypothetical protein
MRHSAPFKPRVTDVRATDTENVLQPCIACGRSFRLKRPWQKQSHAAGSELHSASALGKPFGKALLHLSKSVPAPIPPANSDLRSSRYRPAGGWITGLLDLMTMRVLH